MYFKINEFEVTYHSVPNRAILIKAAFFARAARKTKRTLVFKKKPVSFIYNLLKAGQFGPSKKLLYARQRPTRLPFAQASSRKKRSRGEEKKAAFPLSVSV